MSKLGISFKASGFSKFNDKLSILTSFSTGGSEASDLFYSVGLGRSVTKDGAKSDS